MKTKQDLVSLGLSDYKADEIMLLESKMLEQVVKFQFTKKDGSVRDAEGTLNRALMVQEDGTLWEPKGDARPDTPTLMKFWDVVSKGWKCFTCANFIAMEG